MKDKEVMNIPKKDIAEVIEYGIECPKCGEWIQVGHPSDFDYCTECKTEINIV
jgi:rRNA maturation protein Nop10